MRSGLPNAATAPYALTAAAVVATLFTPNRSSWPHHTTCSRTPLGSVPLHATIGAPSTKHEPSRRSSR
eukprot:726172-Prymnesium_polylepis.1